MLGHFEKVHVRAPALPETCTLANTQEVEERRQEAVAAAPLDTNTSLSRHGSLLRW